MTQREITASEMSMARDLFRRGLAFAELGRYTEAERAYRASLDIAPTRSATWYNLGLVHKARLEWEEALLCNQQAVKILPSDTEAWWNLAMAATALREWETAREGWQRYGLRVPDGEGPPDWLNQWACVRLNPRRSAEVVWVRRMDPVRSTIQNVPLPESGHRWGDIVLHEGTQSDERIMDGIAYPVFDELQRWQPSAWPTLHAEVVAPTPDDMEALTKVMDATGFAAEDWTRGVRRLLVQAPGEPPVVFDGGTSDLWSPVRAIGIAAPLDAALPVISRWANGGSGREATSLVQAA